MNRWLWLSVLWFAGMMYALLLHQGGNAPLPFAHFDKVVHAALFFGQFWLLAKVFLRRRQPVPWQALLLAALVFFNHLLQSLCNYWCSVFVISQDSLCSNQEGNDCCCCKDYF